MQHTCLCGQIKSYIWEGRFFIVHLVDLISNSVHNLLGDFSPSKLAAVGISIGPFQSGSDYQWTKSFLSKFCYLSLRDKRSCDLAAKMQLPGKLVQSFDLAGLLPDVCIDSSKDKINSINLENRRNVYRLGISICHYERYSGQNISIESTREELLLDALKILAKRREMEMHLFVFNGHPTFGDNKITNHFANELNQFAQVKINEYDPDPISVWQKIKTCDGFVGIRLHSGIFAYMAEIPFSLIEYHSKSSDFLDVIGYSDSLRLSSSLPELEEVLAILERTLFSTPFSQLVKMDTKAACKLAQLNFTSIPWVN